MAKSNYHRGSREDKCYFCGSGPPLEEHHVIPQRFDGPDSKENIVELCHLCHTRLEQLYDRSFYEWFGIEDKDGERKFHRQCQTADCKKTVDVTMFNVRRQNLNHVCFKCANELYNRRELRYMERSKKCRSYHFSDEAWDILEDMRGYRPDGSEWVELSDRELRAIGAENLEPVDNNGNLLTRFDIMEEFARRYSDRVSEYLE